MQPTSPTQSPVDSKGPVVESRGAEAALRQIQAEARYFFEPDEFAKLTGRTPGSAAVKQALHRLTRQGRIVRATKRPAGWVIVPAEHAHYGAPPIQWWLADCLNRFESNHYVALLSAARHWGSAHYALQTTQVMVSKPRPSLTVGQLQIDFFAKRNLDRTPTVTVRTDVAPWRVSTREATILDVIRHQAAMGGLETVARITKDFSASLDSHGLVLALDALSQVPAAQRLGFLLDRLGLEKAARIVVRWLADRRLTRQPLELQVTEGERPLDFDKRWGVTYDAHRLSVMEEFR